MKVWGQARIELKTPGSAIRHATDCATGPGIMLLLPSADLLSKFFFSKYSFSNTIRVSNGLDPDQYPHSVDHDLFSYCFQRLSVLTFKAPTKN